MNVFKKHISGFEKTTVIVFWLLLLSALIVQLFYDGDVLPLIAVSAVLSIVFSLLVLLPEIYEFGEENFSVVKTSSKRTIVIPYDSILMFDTVGGFRSSKRDFDTIEVLLTFRTKEGGRKRTISCHPKNVLGFVKKLQEKCPHLMVPQDDEQS